MLLVTTELLTTETLLLLVRLALDLAFVSLLILGVYYRRHRRSDYVFSCIVINLVTFLLCFITQRSNVQLGFALGLFAVFGILRYRTESLPVRDLTYLFAAIGLAIFNGMPGASEPLAQLLLVDVILVAIIALLEFSPWAGRENRALLYDNIALLAPGRESELHADLASRTGLRVVRVRVDRMDLLRESAELTIYYARTGPKPD
jgi:Domain of unknown function (DUF4956)